MEIDEKNRILQTLLSGIKGVAASLNTLEMLILQELDTSIAPVRKQSVEDPDVLGIDSIGRVIKRRKLSPETVEKKRALLKSVRERRLKDIEELKRLRAEKEAREKAALVAAGAHLGKKK